MKCQKCDEDKDVSLFHRDKSRPSGCHPYCKSCRIILAEERRRSKGIKKRGKDPLWREKKRASRMACYNADPQKFRDRSREWRKANAERHISYTDQWRKANPDKAKVLGKVNAQNRRARLLNASPSWYDDAPLKEFIRNAPDGHDVDHIVPLCGLTSEGYPVSGLHVHWNLQYLPLSENRRKWRRMRVEDEPLAPK